MGTIIELRGSSRSKKSYATNDDCDDECVCVWLVLVGGGGQPNTYMAGDPQPYLVTNRSSLGCSDYFSATCDIK